MQNNDPYPATPPVDTPWSPAKATNRPAAAPQPEPTPSPTPRHCVLLHWALMIVGFALIVVIAKIVLG